MDWLNLMTYDLHGPWEGTGPAAHHANLYSDPKDPSPLQRSADKAVDYYTQHGLPGSQTVLGVPFYAHGWTGVAVGKQGGLYQCGHRGHRRLHLQRGLPAARQGLHRP